jgi:hypothetical protein
MHIGEFLVVRGFIPDRLRSSRKTCEHGLTEWRRGLLRIPSGINPLTTGILPFLKIFY